MNRRNAINKIREAYETGQLGFQKGAIHCSYYDSFSDSHCAVGVLIGKKKKLMNGFGNIEYPFLNNKGYCISSAMELANLERLHGMTRKELHVLQALYDLVLGDSNSRREYHIGKFESFLYCLDY